MADDSTGVRGEGRSGAGGQGAPPVFVSVASKRLSQSASLLFATLAERFIIVAAKGLKARMGSGQWTVREREVNFRETRGQRDGVRGRKEVKGRREG